LLNDRGVLDAFRAAPLAIHATAATMPAAGQDAHPGG
jgi:hypothetical protein